MGEVKGYYLPYGYMGWVSSLRRYVLFATEDDYLQWIGDKDEKGAEQ